MKFLVFNFIGVDFLTSIRNYCLGNKPVLGPGRFPVSFLRFFRITCRTPANVCFWIFLIKLFMERKLLSKSSVSYILS